MKKINQKSNIYSSFRDPSGYVYEKNGNIYRKIFPCYFNQYDYLVKSGLYNELVDEGLIVKFEEVKKTKDYIVVKTEKIPFISYPFEWSFDEFKDAAILVLDVMRICLKYNMILKDASSYNVQLYNGTFIFIDILSIDFYEDGLPWGGYGQFCRHFLGPLLLMSYVDMRSNILLRDYIDGIPIDLVDNILKGRGGITSLMHIRWHNKSISKNNDKVLSYKEKNSFSLKKMINMIDMILRQVGKLKCINSNTEWENYYSNTNYDSISFEEKSKIINKYLSDVVIKEDIVFDVGSNDGFFSRIAAKYCNVVVSMDYDYNCVNKNYLDNKKNENNNIVPIVMDFTNPSPSIGFANMERDSLTSRGNIKCVMALAVIHHICISNNVTFDMIASWFSKLGEYLIIEFVPKEDSKVKKLLQTRKDIFDWYEEDIFEKIFGNYFDVIDKNKLKNSSRIIYLMRRKNE